MRMSHKLLGTLAVTIITLVGLSGCGGGGNSNGPVTITVTPSNPSVAVNQMQAFTANVVGGTSPATVMWSVMGAGTINASTGVYTAPASVPATNDIVTATSQGATGSATVNVTAAQSLQITPSGPALPAGSTQTFVAMAGGNPVGSVTWQVNGVTGGDCVSPPNNPLTPCHGTIDSNGNYAAPLAPPAGGVVIGAMSGTDSGTTTPTILFSSASLTADGSTGQYGIQIIGSDTIIGDPLGITASIITSGSPGSPSGTITGGEIDVSGAAGISTAPVTGGTYAIQDTAHGIVNVTLLTNLQNNISSSFTLQLALSTNQHGLLIDFDTFGTGSGTIDAQNMSSFASGPFMANSNHSFTFSGVDPNFFPLFVAGAFAANGGSIPVNPTNAPTNTQDIVDQGLTTPIVTNDITLNGAYTTTVDANGRGQISMTSTTLGTLTFALYMIDQTHANIIELDSGPTAPLLNGQIFSAPTNATALTNGVAFTAGGSGGGNFNPYVIGGVFSVTATTPNNGTISNGGVLDVNTSGRSQTASTITNGTYSNSTAAGNVPGRFTLSLTTSRGTVQFAAYTTTSNTALLVEIDTNTDGATGTAYQQGSPPATLGGSFAANLTGVGASKQFGPVEQDFSGNLSLAATSTTPLGGTLDYNSVSTGPLTLSVNTSGSIVNAPANGRGTASIKVGGNTTTFNLTYYLVNATTTI